LLIADITLSVATMAALGHLGAAILLARIAARGRQQGAK
jgi:hypothetical protein